MLTPNTKNNNSNKFYQNAHFSRNRPKSANVLIFQNTFKKKDKKNNTDKNKNAFKSTANIKEIKNYNIFWLKKNSKKKKITEEKGNKNTEANMNCLSILL